MTTEFACSFCGLTARQVGVLISGPRVFICNECVQLACEVLVEKKQDGMLKTIGDHAPIVATMDKRIHELTLENGTMRRELAFIGESVRRVFPYAIRCMWCEAKLDNEALAKEHVAVCEKHPAVAALAEERAKKRKRGNPAPGSGG